MYRKPYIYRVHISHKYFLLLFSSFVKATLDILQLHSYLWSHLRFILEFPFKSPLLLPCFEPHLLAFYFQYFFKIIQAFILNTHTARERERGGRGLPTHRSCLLKTDSSILQIVPKAFFRQLQLAASCKFATSAANKHRNWGKKGEGGGTGRAETIGVAWHRGVAFATDA